MIRNVVLHLNNEQPLIVDLFEMPGTLDVGLRCTNMRMMNGKRPVFVDDMASVFFFPYLHIRFVEIPPASMVDSDLPLPVPVAAPLDAAAMADLEVEADLEIDEDFLRRVREV